MCPLHNLTATWRPLFGSPPTEAGGPAAWTGRPLQELSENTGVEVAVFPSPAEPAVGVTPLRPARARQRSLHHLPAGHGTGAGGWRQVPRVRGRGPGPRRPSSGVPLHVQPKHPGETPWGPGSAARALPAAGPHGSPGTGRGAGALGLCGPRSPARLTQPNFLKRPPNRTAQSRATATVCFKGRQAGRGPVSKPPWWRGNRHKGGIPRSHALWSANSPECGAVPHAMGGLASMGWVLPVPTPVQASRMTPFLAHRPCMVAHSSALKMPSPGRSCPGRCG